MNKRELALLERAFNSEIVAALQDAPRSMQTTSKLADAMVANGLLIKSVEFWRGVKIEGYELTHAGRFAYCETCGGAEAEGPMMGNKAKVSIDCDEETVTVEIEQGNPREPIWGQIETTKAELVATILAVQSRELMAMSKQELMARHLVMLGIG